MPRSAALLLSGLAFACISGKGSDDDSSTSSIDINSAEDVATLCAESEPQTATLTVDFPATAPGCPWGEGDNLDTEDAHVTARVEQVVSLDLPPGVEEISMHHDAHVIDHLAEVQVPVLVLLGERDTRFAASAALFQRDLDVHESVVVADMGHMVHVKAPAECAAAVRRFMAGLAGDFPGYGWERNPGYGTPEHQAALERLGVTPQHRHSYAPIRRLLEPQDMGV